MKNPRDNWRIDVNRLDMQEHQGVVTRDKAKQLKSHKDQIEQGKFQGLNFDVQDFMGRYAKVLNKLEIENSPWLYISFGLKIWEGRNISIRGLNLGLKFWLPRCKQHLQMLQVPCCIHSFRDDSEVARSFTFSSPFKGTFSLLLVTLVLFVLSLTSWMKFYALEDQSTSFGIRATFELVLTVVSILLPQEATDYSITLGQPSSTNLQPNQRLKREDTMQVVVRTKRTLNFREDLNGLIEKEEDESGESVEGEENGDGDSRTNPFRQGEDDVNWLDMQEHQGVVTRAKTKQLKNHKNQIEQEKFQGLNFDVQEFMGQYTEVLNKLEIENSP
ncbi:hypothetical protein M9H77_14220 [Catharanthus roseus]|uniref:Uncharacterized protein n=1 Tax=Catharanthus roseus TaxID=4058 RepID=A0ACC0BMP1_CATRO|nr:hypothetical protein M9H77_14220 [Catharanthus roseus]